MTNNFSLVWYNSHDSFVLRYRSYITVHFSNINWLLYRQLAEEYDAVKEQREKETLEKCKLAEELK